MVPQLGATVATLVVALGFAGLANWQMRRPFERRWLPVVERIYDWHYRHEGYLRNESSLARVAVLHSELTESFHACVAAGDRDGDHVLGMYQALVEARVPFEFLHEAFLTPDRLYAFKLLILAGGFFAATRIGRNGLAFGATGEKPVLPVDFFGSSRKVRLCGLKHCGFTVRVGINGDDAAGALCGAAEAQ